VNSNQQQGSQGIFVVVGRAVGRSRSGRVFVAIAVASVFYGLGYAAWHAPDFVTAVVSIWLVLHGLKLAWRLLPIPSATRARWKRMTTLTPSQPERPLPRLTVAESLRTVFQFLLMLPSLVLVVIPVIDVCIFVIELAHRHASSGRMIMFAMTIPYSLGVGAILASAFVSSASRISREWVIVLSLGLLCFIVSTFALYNYFQAGIGLVATHEKILIIAGPVITAGWNILRLRRGTL
jgi:hypothetical protein